jgi:hypothetical protein
MTCTSLTHVSTLRMMANAMNLLQNVLLAPGAGMWSKLRVEGASPPPRNAHSATMVPGKGILIFGGSSPELGPLGDLYLLSRDGEGAPRAYPSYAQA